MSRHARKPAQRPTEKIKGEVVDFTVKTPDLWGVGQLRTTQAGGYVKISGKLLGAKVGDTVELEGFFEEHPRWGTSFKFRACEAMVPADASGVVSWMAATLPNISRRRAEQLVERHGVEGVWRILDARDENTLCEIDGINGSRAREIFDVYHANKAERDRMVRLRSWGLTDAQIAKVLEAWGEEAEARIADNPYELMEHVAGFGWKRADEVALRMGIAKDAPGRIAAGILHFLESARGEGHCFVPMGKVAAVVGGEKILGGVDEAKVRERLNAMLDAGRLVAYGARVYLRAIADVEAGLARAFADRARAMAKAG